MIINKKDVINFAKQQCENVNFFMAYGSNRKNSGFEHINKRHVLVNIGTCLSRLLKTQVNQSGKLLPCNTQKYINGEEEPLVFSKFNTKNFENILPLIRDCIVYNAYGIINHINVKDSGAKDFLIDFTEPIGTGVVRISENQIQEFELSSLCVTITCGKESSIAPYDIITAYPVPNMEETDYIIDTMVENQHLEISDEKLHVNYSYQKGMEPTIPQNIRPVFLNQDLKEIYDDSFINFAIKCDYLLSDDDFNRIEQEASNPDIKEIHINDEEDLSL